MVGRGGFGLWGRPMYLGRGLERAFGSENAWIERFVGLFE